ncbi:hypothetical protein TRAPUB_3648 [Trametes pubescens]|uniref:CxC2-like cysteine cluster KDZ transposase-associated domain-containing protein n=1 Tax=Trametes pubescens TaxID=154538 RepID=A0A1M2VD60_TRAPU|nr:hypothetical protein TRAPUB_3648 [Trametes pubescens]
MQAIIRGQGSVEGQQAAFRTGFLYEKDTWTRSYDSRAGAGIASTHALDAALQAYNKGASTDVSTAWRSHLTLFHELTLQAKTNTYDFYQSLLRATDNSGTSKHPHRYKQFCHTVRLWRHLRQLKRGGRGHDPAGASATAPGSLAVVCPACPHPGKNLPDDWDLTPPDKLWIYTLYLMMDANFRCRCKDRGLDGVSLAPGWSYYVDDQKFQDYLQNDCGFETEYCRNFERRMARNFPEEMRLDLEDVNVRWMIPKNHIAVHGPKHSRYSLNFNDKVGRTYGEGVESSWSHLNPASMSTREMALATRHEVLDDHMGAWNWQKVIGLGGFVLHLCSMSAHEYPSNIG